jgi:hypothetical protein
MVGGTAEVDHPQVADGDSGVPCIGVGATASSSTTATWRAP